MEELVDIDLAIGAQVRALRERAGATRDELARATQRAGTRWGADRIAHLEAGRATSATLANLLALARGLAEVLERPVELAELLPEVGRVALSPDQVMQATQLRAVLSGTPVTALVVPRIGTVTDPRLEPGWGKVDDRLVIELGVPPEVIRVATSELYGRSATQERDGRAGEDATPQKRGRVTRGLLDEVAAQVHSDRAADAAMDAEAAGRLER